MRGGLYIVLALLPIIGAYDYGSAEPSQVGFWERLLVSLALAAVIAIVGEATLFFFRARRH